MKKYKSPWPVAIVAFFAVVFAVNFTFLYIAIRSDDGLTDEDYYQKGLLYNQRIENELALGWRIELSFKDAPGPRAGNTVMVSILKKDGTPVEGADVKVVLRRPATDRYDNEFRLLASGPLYRGDVSIPLNGYWDVRVVADKDGHAMDRTFRIKV